MSDELLLGVDVGTATTKGVLTTPIGEVVAQHEVEHELSIPRAGWAEHDAESAWWGDFVAICGELLTGRRPGAVKAVGVSGIGPCFVPADHDGRALRPAILYGIDTRAAAEIAELDDRLGRERIVQRTGSALTSQAVGPKLLWYRRNEPDRYRRTRYVLPASSLLVQRLTGEYVIDRHTASGFNPLYDVGAGEWIDDWAGAVLGEDGPPLPRLLWATEAAGEVSAAGAEATGLAPGTPVAAGTIDAAAEALSVGVREPGDLMLMYGSTMFLILVVDRPQPDPRVWGTQYVIPGTANIAAGMATSGVLTAWFRDLLGGDGRAPSYQDLVDAAGDVPAGAEGLVCLPYFSGERTPIHDPDARGVLAGLTLRHGRGHIYRALLEATAYAVRHNLETIDDIGAEVRRAVEVGGGTRSDLWPQIVADVTGVDQEVPGVTVGAALGDCMLAGIAVGLVALDAAWNPIERTIAAAPESTPRYDELYGVYRELYPATRAQMHALARLGTGAPE